MAETLTISRPHSGRRVKTPPKKEIIASPRGERVLWQEFRPPFDMQREIKRSILIGRIFLVFLLIVLSIIFTLVVIIPALEFVTYIAIIFFPAFALLIWQIRRYVDATDSFKELQVRYPLSEQVEYREYFLVTNKRVINKSWRNFSRTSHENLRKVAFIDGDVFTGILTSLASIQVRKSRSNKMKLRLRFEINEAAVPEMNYFSNNYYTSMSPEQPGYFFPDVIRSVSNFVYYSSLYATTQDLTVTLNSNNVQELCQVLQNQVPQASVKILGRNQEKRDS